MSKALAQMESVTKTTAANAESGAAASEELSAQADVSKEMVLSPHAVRMSRDRAA